MLYDTAQQHDSSNHYHEPPPDRPTHEPPPGANRPGDGPNHGGPPPVAPPPVVPPPPPPIVPPPPPVDPAIAAQQAAMNDFQKKQMEAALAAQGQANAQYNQIGASARSLGSGYDASVAAAYAGGPQAAAERELAASQKLAQPQALTMTDEATRQAIKAGRTSGMLGGQASLAALQGAGSNYNQNLMTQQNAATQSYRTMLSGMQQGGQEMAGRQLNAAGGLAGISGQASQNTMTVEQQRIAREQLAAQQQMQREQLEQQYKMFTEKMTDDEKNKFLDMLMQGLSSGLGFAAMGSDKRIKDDIKPVSFLDGLERVKSKSYRYKGNDRPEAGLIAQDLEKTNMSPAVVIRGDGIKMIDPARLSTMNTAAIAEMKSQVKDLVEKLGKIEKPKGKE